MPAFMRYGALLDEESETEDYKEKTKGDDYKYKNDSPTINVKKGKVKVKKSSL